MAYNTVAIKKDVDNKPIPQYYNPLVDAYEVLQGRNGASRVELYNSAGNAIDIEALLNAISALLTAIKDTAGIRKIVDPLPAGDNNIGNVDVVSSVLPTGASTEAKQDVIISAIDTVIQQLQQPITLGGSIMEYYGKSADTKPTGVPVGSTFFEIDTKQVYIFDGESWVML